MDIWRRDDSFCLFLVFSLFLSPSLPFMALLAFFLSPSLSSALSIPWMTFRFECGHVLRLFIVFFLACTKWRVWVACCFCPFASLNSVNASGTLFNGRSCCVLLLYAVNRIVHACNIEPRIVASPDALPAWGFCCFHFSVHFHNSKNKINFHGNCMLGVYGQLMMYHTTWH